MAVFVEVVGGVEGREFLSPSRILARSFRLSRDQWKAKAGRAKAEVKRLKVNVHDLQLSRSNWRERAESAESKLAAMPAGTAALTEAATQKKRRAASASRW